MLMNSKKITLLSVALGMFAFSTAIAQAQMHRANGSRAGSRAPARASHPMTAHTTASRQFRDGDHDFDGRRFDRDFDDRFRFFNNFAFFGAGFPFFFPYPYYGYYPYGYDGYYAPPPVYDGYAPPGYQGSGNVSLVLQVQRRLAHAGYYHGTIDGVIGSGTRQAIRAYERAHGLPVDGRIDAPLLAAMGLA